MSLSDAKDSASSWVIAFSFTDDPSDVSALSGVILKFSTPGVELEKVIRVQTISDKGKKIAVTKCAASVRSL